MNKKLKAYLEKKIEISQKLLEGKMFYVRDSQIDCVPVPVMTVTAAKKKGLVLKRGAKMVGEWRFTLSRANGTGYGNLFLSSSFKKKEI
tara:strand:- start:324 stop:590 length:267 start_codon:yes stop_codon:yes gene_type:complete